MPEHYRLIIIGSGPAGLTAALYSARANLDPVVFEGVQPGGQLTITTEVENFPGFPKGIHGPELMELMREQAQRFGAKSLYKNVTMVDLSAQPFRLWSEEIEYTADSLIVATGASAKWLGIPSEKTYMGYGVSACATCDGFFFKGQDVAVIGGGNTAVEEALYLSNIARRVILVHRRDKLRAEKIMIDKLMKKAKDGNVSIEWNHVLRQVLGDNSGVTGISIRDVSSNASKDLPVKGVFVAIGHSPNTGIFAGQVEMENGYIVTRGGRNGDSTATSVPGVFAAGDVQDHIYRQAVTSAGSGCMAALDAEKYLDDLAARA